MVNLELYLSAVESDLEQGQFDEALETLSELRTRFPEYTKDSSGYLVDYFQGQAKLRRELDEGRNPAELRDARQFLEKSLSLCPGFAVAHLLAGYSSMVLARQGEDRTHDIRSAYYHLSSAKRLNPALSPEVDRMLHHLNPELGRSYEIMK